jgi:hypothetical protein
MSEQIPDYETRSRRQQTGTTSSRWFCIAIIGIGVVLNLLMVMLSFADVDPSVRGSLKGLGAAAVALELSPVLNGVLMLISLAAALVIKFSGPRTPCVLVAVMVPLLGTAINVVVLVSIFPKGSGAGPWTGAH